MQWDKQETWDHDLLAFHKQAIALRKAHPALRTGAYRRLAADHDTYAFARSGDGETLLVAVNVAEQPRSIALPTGDLFAGGAELIALYGTGRARVVAGQITVDLPARDGVILIAA
jgi:alpha-glucosidase